MILGLDVSTSITGATILDSEGGVVYNEAWDTRKFKNFFEKVKYVEKRIEELHNNGFGIRRVYIEQSLQSFRSGFSSAKTLSTLSRFNGVVSWLVYRILQTEPEYIAATSARKTCGIKVSKGQKGKQVVIQYIIDNVPDVTITYTKHGNPKPGCFDKADSWVIARAGWLLCQSIKN
jgi:glycerol kinase